MDQDATGRPVIRMVRLPAPLRRGGRPLWQTLSQRRSQRHYENAPVSLEELSQLLWAAHGVNATYGSLHLRTAPSAGALFPIETYVVANNVSDLEAGLYHFDAPDLALSQLRVGNLGHEISLALVGQRFVALAAAVFVWTAVPERSKRRYFERAYRYIYLDAGHIAQNLLLAATALGLSACPVGAFYDDDLNHLLGLKGRDETAVYTACVGRPGQR